MLSLSPPVNVKLPEGASTFIKAPEFISSCRCLEISPNSSRLIVSYTKSFLLGVEAIVYERFVCFPPGYRFSVRGHEN